MLWVHLWEDAQEAPGLKDKRDSLTLGRTGAVETLGTSAVGLHGPAC